MTIKENLSRSAHLCSGKSRFMFEDAMACTLIVYKPTCFRCVNKQATNIGDLSRFKWEIILRNSILASKYNYVLDTLMSS